MDIPDVKSIFAAAMYDFELFENSVLKNLYSGRIQAVQYLNIFVYILCKQIEIPDCLFLNENLFFMQKRNKIQSALKFHSITQFPDALNLTKNQCIQHTPIKGKEKNQQKVHDNGITDMTLSKCIKREHVER